MQRVIIYFLFLLSTNLFCQEKNTAVEIYFGTEGVVPASKKITFYMTAQSTVWGGTNGPPKEYWISNKFNNLDYTPENNNNNFIYWSGFDFVLSPTIPPYYDIFGCGLYKIVSSENPNYYFYIDYRDDRYGSYTGSNGHNADIWIKYVDPNYFYLSNDPSTLGFLKDPIPNEELLRIWELKGQESPSTDEFPDFWSNALALIKLYDEVNYVFRPRLVWGPHPTFPTTHYKIYRSIPNTTKYSLIATVNNAIFEYVDEEIE